MLPTAMYGVCIETSSSSVSGLSGKVIEDRNALILSQIEEHAPNKEKYVLLAKVVNVGVALLVYGRDDTVGRKVEDVQTQWTGCGPGFMGNKGAVGVRFRVRGDDGGIGEVYTCVIDRCAVYPSNALKIHLFYSLSLQVCVLASDCTLVQTAKEDRRLSPYSWDPAF